MGERERGRERARQRLWSSVWYVAAWFVTLNLSDSSFAQIDVLCPRNREMFARTPVPIMVHVFGDMASDPDLNLVVELDGVGRVLDEPVQEVIEGEIRDIANGYFTLYMWLEHKGRPVQDETLALNFSVRTDTDDGDLVHYIPPRDAARPRVLHWLVSPRDEEPPHPAPASSDTTAAIEVLERFAERQKKVMNDPALFREAKFLVSRHYPTSGMGNLFQSLVSAFLVALLSDRIFLHDAFLVEEFLDLPRLTSSNYSAVFDYFGHRHVATNSQWFLYTGVQDWMLCDSLDQHLTQQFAFIESDQYFAGLLVNNDHYALRLHDWFGDSLFGKVSAFLFRPRPSIALEVRDFVKEHLAGRKSIGVHVRTHTLGHPGFIEPYALNDGQGHFLNSYWKCAYYAGGASGVPGDLDAPIVFLSTDNGGVIHEAVSWFGGQLVYKEGPISRSDVEGQRSALVDLLILAECDHIVTTQMSTFSYVAHALASKVPYIVNFQGACVRDISSEPCMHAWRHVAAAAPCMNGDLPFTSTVETRNCGYYTQQSLTAPQNCEWIP